jgi:hypothetical protein
MMVMNKDFKLAKSDRVKDLEIEIDYILQELDCEGALVTDESIISDFIGIFLEDGERDAILDDLSKRLDIEIMDDYECLVDVAQRLREKKKQ